ncbi:MAG TPA: hypothetical protein VMB73_03325 [Acetobacteraceae bacterium]|nr:hypothetical protein [Acetobacteraceae bacterium]
MTAMIAEVYDASLAAGALEDKARAAVRAIADYDSRFNKIEADLQVRKWMTGAIVAGVISLILKAFT